MTKRWWMSIALAAVLSGCASEPSVYYTLTPPVGAQSQDLSHAPGVGLYALGAVSVPAPVDDVLIVVRQSDDRLMKLAHDRWTAPLGKQVGNALAVALTNELGMPPLARTQAGTDGKDVASVSVDIQRFDLVPGQYAELSALWQITPAKTSSRASRIVCYTKVRESVEPGVAPLVKAQQANIERLAKAVAAGLRAEKSGPQTRCQ